MNRPKSFAWIHFAFRAAVYIRGFFRSSFANVNPLSGVCKSDQQLVMTTDRLCPCRRCQVPHHRNSRREDTTSFIPALLAMRRNMGFVLEFPETPLFHFQQPNRKIGWVGI